MEKVTFSTDMSRMDVLESAEKLVSIINDKNDLFYLGLTAGWVRMVKRNVLNDFGDNFDNIVEESKKNFKESVDIMPKNMELEDLIYRLKEENETKAQEIENLKFQLSQEKEKSKSTIKALQDELLRKNKELSEKENVISDLKCKELQADLLKMYKEYVLDLLFDEKERE